MSAGWPRADQWPSDTFLGGLRGDDLRRVLDACTPRSYLSEECLQWQGELDTSVTVLLTGFVKVKAAVEGGRDVLLEVRTGGDVLGVESLLDGRPHESSAFAVEGVRAGWISGTTFQQLLAEIPGVQQAVSRHLTTRLRRATKRSLDLSTVSAAVRVARIVLEIAEAYGTETDAGLRIRPQITQPELASAAGAAEATVRKTLLQLRNEGVLETGYRTFVVRDMAALRRHARQPN